MYANWNGKTYKIEFAYPLYPLTGRRATLCEIFELNPDVPGEQKVVVRGIVRLHHLDNFEYETGRVLALTRAMIMGNFPRDQRKSLWTAYHLRSQVALPQYVVDLFTAYTKNPRGFVRDHGLSELLNPAPLPDPDLEQITSATL